MCGMFSSTPTSRPHLPTLPLQDIIFPHSRFLKPTRHACPPFQHSFPLTPPTAYYLPPSSVYPPFKLTPAPPATRTLCEWKGLATYWTLTHTPSSADPSSESITVKN